MFQVRGWRSFGSWDGVWVAWEVVDARRADGFRVDRMGEALCLESGCCGCRWRIEVESGARRAGGEVWKELLIRRVG